MKCAMPAWRAPGTRVSPTASSDFASAALKTLSGTPCARACPGASMTSTPPTENASAPMAAPFMKARRSTGSMISSRWRLPPALVLLACRLSRSRVEPTIPKLTCDREKAQEPSEKNMRRSVGERYCGLQGDGGHLTLLLHDHLGADRHALVKIDDLVIGQPE